MLLFLVDLINIEIFRISFRFFYSFSFILRSRATSVWYQSLTLIRDQVISVYFLFLLCLFQIFDYLHSKKNPISVSYGLGLYAFKFFFSSILLHRALDPYNFLHVRKRQNCLIHKYMIRALVLTTARNKAYQSDSRYSRFPTIQACSFGSLCSSNSPSKDHRCKPASTSFGLFCC